MKKKLLALVLVLAMALTVGLVACGDNAPEPKTGLAFGYAHWNGLGFVEVKVQDGKIIDAVIDEIALPYQWVVPAAHNAERPNVLATEWTGTLPLGRLPGTSGGATPGYVGNDAAEAFENMGTGNIAANVVVSANNDTDSYAPGYHAGYPDAGRQFNLTMAKYIRIGNKYFEADLTNAPIMSGRKAADYKEIGAGSGLITSLHTHLFGGKGGGTVDHTKFEANQANAKWYYDAVMAGQTFIVMEVAAAGTGTTTVGGKHFKDVTQAYASFTPLPSTGQEVKAPIVQTGTGTTAPRTLTKRGSNYWGSSNSTNGLLLNYDLMELFLIRHGASFTWAQMTRGAANTGPGGGRWSVDGIRTGATADDFPYYMWIAKLAFDAAK